MVVTGGSLTQRPQKSLNRCLLAEATWQINEQNSLHALEFWNEDVLFTFDYSGKCSVLFKKIRKSGQTPELIMFYGIRIHYIYRIFDNCVISNMK